MENAYKINTVKICTAAMEQDVAPLRATCLPAFSRVIILLSVGFSVQTCISCLAYCCDFIGFLSRAGEEAISPVLQGCASKPVCVCACLCPCVCACVCVCPYVVWSYMRYKCPHNVMKPVLLSLWGPLFHSPIQETQFYKSLTAI